MQFLCAEVNREVPFYKVTEGSLKISSYIFSNHLRNTLHCIFVEEVGDQLINKPILLFKLLLK